MKIIKCTGITILLAILISGCVSSTSRIEPQENPLTRQYIAKGQALEREMHYTDALEQYRLALSVDPENAEALLYEKNILTQLWDIAQQHYTNGLALEQEGKHEAARDAYLSALQNWPDHAEAKKKLTPTSESGEIKDCIVHTVASGESVSKIAIIYYGDYKKHTIIGKFNVLKDATKVRVGEKIKVPVIEGVTLSDLEKKQAVYLESAKKNSADPAAQTLPMENKKPATAQTQPEPIQPPSETDQQEAPPQITEPLKAPKADAKEPDSYDQGISLFNEKNYAESIPFFQAAAQNHPHDETVLSYLFKSYFQQALILFNTEDYLAARDNFKAALKIDQNCDKCPEYIEKCETTYKEKHYNLGIHYFGKEQLNRAIEEWTQVKDLDPAYKEVTPNLQKAKMLFQRLESIKKSTVE